MGAMTIDGKLCQMEENDTIFDVAVKNNVQMDELYKQFLLLPELKNELCLFEERGPEMIVSGLTTVARDGMDVRSRSDPIRERQRAIIDKLFVSGAHNCFTSHLDEDKCPKTHSHARNMPWHDKECPSKKSCLLKIIALKLKVDVMNAELHPQTPVVDDCSPFIVRDYSRCIRCEQCIDICRHIGNDAIEKKKYNDTWHPSLDYKKCTHCGQCIDECPVGAIFDRKWFASNCRKTSEVASTCPYCGTGCNMLLHVENRKIVKVTGKKDSIPNNGRLCVKGRFGYDYIYSENRLKSPKIKKGGKFYKVSWEESLDYVAEKLTSIRKKHGPDSIAGLACARSITEDSYNMQKFFRSTIGTNNIDHCART